MVFCELSGSARRAAMCTAVRCGILRKITAVSACLLSFFSRFKLYCFVVIDGMVASQGCFYNASKYTIIAVPI